MDSTLDKLDGLLAIQDRFSHLLERADKMFDTEFSLFTDSPELVKEGLPERAEDIQKRILLAGFGMIERLLEGYR